METIHITWVQGKGEQCQNYQVVNKYTPQLIFLYEVHFFRLSELRFLSPSSHPPGSISVGSMARKTAAGQAQLEGGGRESKVNGMHTARRAAGCILASSHVCSVE